jgi:hypothetical protein
MSPHYRNKLDHYPRHSRSSKPRPASPALWQALNSIRTKSLSLDNRSRTAETIANRRRYRLPPEPTISIDNFSDFRASALKKLTFALDNSYTGKPARITNTLSSVSFNLPKIAEWKRRRHYLAAMKCYACGSPTA